MANLTYNIYKKNVGDAEMDFSSDSSQEFRIILTTDSYTPDADHTSVADITNELATGTGYSAFADDNKILANILSSVDNAADQAQFDADDTTWTSSTITARYAIIYKYVDTTPANCPLVCLVDFGSDKSSSDGDFTIQWSTDGFLTHD